MGQGRSCSAEYRFEVECYASPAGVWRVDLRVTEDWGKHFARIPLASGMPGEFLSDVKRRQLVDVVRAHLERGIDHIIAPF